VAEYKLLIKPSALKELESVPKKIAGQIIQRIAALKELPRPYGCQKLSAQESYRIRQGNYRIVYSIDEVCKVVDVIKIAHRREVYRQ
jgi:mRNA interferase RelE/StbE